MSTIFQERELKADINTNTSGDNIIIGPGVGQMPAAWENSAEHIAIDFIVLFPAAAVTVQLKSGSVNYGGPYALSAQQPFVFDNAAGLDDGVMTMAPNANFVINLGGAVQVSGFVRYRRRASN